MIQRQHRLCVMWSFSSCLARMPDYPGVPRRVASPEPCHQTDQQLLILKHNSTRIMCFISTYLMFPYRGKNKVPVITKGLANRGTANPICSKKNYMINTSLFIRILNPIRHKKMSKISVYFQKMNIYSDLI